LPVSQTNSTSAGNDHGRVLAGQALWMSPGPEREPHQPPSTPAGTSYLGLAPGGHQRAGQDDLARHLPGSS